MCAVRAEILTIRWSRCHFVTFFSQPFLPFLYLRTCALHDNVTARRIGAQGLESQVLEGTPQVAGVEFLIDTAAAYNLQRTANRHELAPLYSHRLSEINVDEILSRLGHFEMRIMLRQLLDIALREPVLEALAVEGIRLGVDVFVVERIVARRQDALHLEGQPAAVARQVREELDVIARAAERGDVRPVLGIAVVGHTLVPSCRAPRSTADRSWSATAGRPSSCGWHSS